MSPKRIVSTPDRVGIRVIIPADCRARGILRHQAPTGEAGGTEAGSSMSDMVVECLTGLNRRLMPIRETECRTELQKTQREDAL